METILSAPRIFVPSPSAGVPGKWFDVDDYADASELIAAISAYSNAPAGKYLVTGYEGFTPLLYREKMDFQALYKYLDLLDEFIPYPSAKWFEALGVYLQAKNITEPTAATIQAFDDSYQGHYEGTNPKREFTLYLVSILAKGSCDPEAIKRHLNIETFQEELFTGNYWELGGHIFYGE